MTTLTGTSFDCVKTFVCGKILQYQKTVDSVSTSKTDYNNFSDYMTACKFVKFESNKIAVALALVNNAKDSGAVGRALEMCLANSLSVKKKVSEQNEFDAHVKISSGKGVEYIGCEIKSGGGRLDDMRGKYIIYVYVSAITRQENGIKHKEYLIHKPVIMETRLFMDKLHEFNAIKKINKEHKFNGYGIQPNNKRFRQFVENALPYQKNKTYTVNEIENYYK